MPQRLALHKLVVLGDGGVGKTALTVQLCFNHFIETYDPTIEDSYRKQVMIDGVSCILEILDTAGQEEYAALRDQWIREGEGFILVYAINSRPSFSCIKTHFAKIQRAKDLAAGSTSNDNNASHPPVMLLANKCDQTIDRVVSFREGRALADELGCGFIETSAKTCENVEKAYYDVVRQLRGQLYPSRSSERGGPSSGPSRHGRQRHGEGSAKARKRKLNSDANCIIL